MKTTSHPYRLHPGGPRRWTRRWTRRVARDRKFGYWPPILPIVPRRPLRGCMRIFGQSKATPEGIYTNPSMRQAYRDWLGQNCERMIADGRVTAAMVRKCFRLTEHAQIPRRYR